MADENPQPELIPYASHVAHGTGRTPIGIILFAASHLLLGACLVVAVVRFASGVRPVSPWLGFFVVTVIATGWSMLVGGAVLLMKGQGAWMLSVSAFAWLAGCESAIAAFAEGWAAMGLQAADRAALYFGGMLLVMASPMFVLCVIVLGYLGAEKSRDTFALPPGQTPIAVRWLPKVAIAVFLAAVMIGASIGRSM